MSRNVCRYYAQGTCRFGNNCRFLHVDERGSSAPFGGYQTSNRYEALDGNAGGYGGRGYQQNSGYGQQNFNDRQILEIVQKEINEWERSKQWPLSCFAPTKNGACVPGLDDISPEELRAAAYACKGDSQKEQAFASAYRSGVEEVQQWLRRVAAGDRTISQVLVSLAKNENPSWTSPTVGDGLSRLKLVVQQLTAPGMATQEPSAASSMSSFGSNLSAGGSSVFGGSQQTSGFGGSSTAQASSPFGKPTFGAAPSITSGTGGFVRQASSPFGEATSSTSTFGTAASSPFGGSSFGTAAPNVQPFAGSQTSQSAFGGGSASPFGTSQQSVFGQKPSPFGTAGQAATSPFGATTQAASPFGTSSQVTSPFGAATQSAASPFGSSAQPVTSPFGSTTHPVTSPFGAQTQAVTSPFGTAPQTAVTSPFGAATQAVPNPFSTTSQTTTQSPFGAATAAGPTGGSTSVFGGGQASSGGFGAKPFGIFGGADAGAPAGDDQCYSKMDMLTEEDLNEFKAQAFDLARIPSVPPPRELC